jgi:uncharacterized membrane protein YhaH (DUF805 family)
MRDFFNRNSERREYRLASTILIAGAALPMLVTRMIELSSGVAVLAFAIAALSYLLLTILTYYRLRNASLSGWWLLPMIIVFHFGPRWQLGSWSWGSSSFSPSGLVCFVPIILGWFAVAKTSDGAAITGTETG